MTATRRERVLSRIDVTQGRGVEVGALCSPIVTKSEAAVWYVDVQSTEDLREHYAGDPSVPADQLVEVDAALYADGRLRPIAEATEDIGLFDWAVASHVVEHVPDLVTWLGDMADCLVDDGKLALAVPDRRYSFDALRAGTSVGQALLAHHSRDQRPSVRAVYDHLSDAVTISAHDAWNGLVATREHRVHERALVHQVLAQHAASEDYIDCHVWLFTPAEFVAQLADLAELGLLDFVVEDVVPTPVGQLEFYVTLRRIPRSAPAEVRAELVEHGFHCPPDNALPPAPVADGVPLPVQAVPEGLSLRMVTEREQQLLDLKRRLLTPAHRVVHRLRARLRS